MVSVASCESDIVQRISMPRSCDKAGTEDLSDRHYFQDNPYDGQIGATDYSQVVDSVTGIEGRPVDIEILVKFTMLQKGEVVPGLVARSSSGQKYLLTEIGGVWRAALPSELEQNIRKVEHRIALQRTALSTFGHQWSGE